ncbi:PREDICTED: uncharacterized protein LOC109193890 [Ipomoea nil]|uniref:uncharacterized protein LOC109193890 n=1 Tax=Ipomoea nil TaxID=35883 RepID=UPI0009012D7E|nr:PREDICTED: uncharacterized protein LOC109193890 [Ipomoea nil]
MDVQGLIAGAASITLEDEEVGVRFDDVAKGVVGDAPERQTWSIVGRFLTDRLLKQEIMKRVMASAWRPLMGIEVSDVQPNLYLFTFFNKADMERVLTDGPWAFENATFLCQPLNVGEDPTQVVLSTVDIWLQVFDLPPGYRTVKVLEKIGDFAGVFLHVDDRNFTRPWVSYYRIRITHDVTAPIKRRMKMVLRDGSSTWVNFKYERLHMFCFFCGKMGHTDKFCLEARRSGLRPEQFLFGPGLWAGGSSPTKVLGDKWFQMGQERRRVIGYGSVAGEVTVTGQPGLGAGGSVVEELVVGGGSSGRGMEEEGVRAEPKRRRVEEEDGLVVREERGMNVDSVAGCLARPED